MDEFIGRPFTKAEMDRMRGLGEEEARRDEAGLNPRFWAKIKRFGRQIPFAEDLLAAYYCTLDPATPTRVRVVLLGAIAYFVMPFDAVADLLPFFGFADDAAVIAAAIAQVAGAINDGHREKAREALKDQED